LVVKAVIWLLALGSGTSGGVLAPLLMMGAGLGLVLAPWLPGGSPGLWPLVCMAGVLGSVLGAPLTAIVFAFGLTHASNALLPLIATTAVAYGVNVLWMKRSIMTEKIARRGLHVHREYGVDPLERVHVEDLMSAPQTLDASLPADAALAQCRAGTHVHRYYPVTHGRQLLGMLALRTLEAADPAQVCGLLLEPDRGYL
ncbi:chloride channel protein, partial [Herbaspirillum frisingense]